MELPDILAATLGLSSLWKITHISSDISENRRDISVIYSGPDIVSCPVCGRLIRVSDIVDETWFHNDFFSQTTYLHAKVPHVRCCEHKSIDKPWTRLGSRFRRLHTDVNNPHEVNISSSL